MRAKHIDCISPADRPDSFPIHLEQRTGRFSALLFLALLAPAVALMMAALIGIATAAIAEPETRAAVIGDPLTMAKTVAGTVIWILLWSIPLVGFARRLTQSRRIEVFETGAVRVVDRGLFGQTTWSGALDDFVTLRHTVRSSLSGTRHEVSLEDEQGHMTLLLHAAPVITEQEARQMARLLGFPTVVTQGVTQGMGSASDLAVPVVIEGQALAA